jgi:hypothetical protein
MMEQAEDNMQEVLDQENVEHQQVEAEQEGVVVGAIFKAQSDAWIEMNHHCVV